jgi:hypothetical protein
MRNSAVDAQSPFSQPMSIITEVQVHLAEEDVDKFVTWVPDGIVGVSGSGVERAPTSPGNMISRGTASVAAPSVIRSEC